MTPVELAKPNTEHAHQRALFAAINLWIWTNEQAGNIAYSQAMENAKLLFAIPNGGDRHGATAGRMKAEGTKAGVWDLFLPVPRPVPNPENKITLRGLHYHGLWIEMKQSDRRNHKDGGLSSEQCKFGYAMDNQGYDVHVCYTWEEAFSTILTYLGAK